MIYVLDSSVFLQFLFNEEWSDSAGYLLANIESGIDTAYTLPLILEEVAFKLLIGKVVEITGKKSSWEVREILKKDKNVRKQAYAVVLSFSEYIQKLTSKGLRIEPFLTEDLLLGFKIGSRYGIMTADAILVAFAIRRNIRTIATFDEDFKLVEEIKVLNLRK
ncbi:MAG: type II toxin-antitoxin system VapC family toxin [Candidatus Njordarchaeia archaeon]